MDVGRPLMDRLKLRRRRRQNTYRHRLTAVHRLNGVLSLFMTGELDERTAFREAVRPFQNGALLDEAEGREELSNIVLSLLFIKHADEQLSVFNS